MADEVVYSDLNFPKAGLAQSPQACDSHQCPRWHPIALRVGGAAYIVLLVAVALLSVSVIQRPKAKAGTSPETEATPQRSRNRSDCNSSLDRLMPYLKQHMCEPEQRTSTDTVDCQKDKQVDSRSKKPIYPSRETQCFLCPKDWLFRGSKCYKVFDKIQNNWNRSNEDCTKRHAQMLVIQDQEEQAFIKNIVKNKNAVWIGLRFNSWNKKWFWMDDSPLQRSMWPELSPEEVLLDSCGTFKANTIAFEPCKTHLSWVCQMKAFVI